MRAIFGVVGLLMVVAIVAVLAKKQLGAGVAPPAASTSVPGVAAPTGTPKQQVDQFQKAVEGAVQAPRPMPEEPK
ncbi:hypothetical protein FN976_07435 [Caenimonas sedimenti]|uniref:Uncharacterized protein n=1 Tax=Caenimonas sedimenti TaxID=2596921 RepID=A0A562ZT88_9BURK|nr:hypothetical protein [Caenimonas sedimenti]TWO71820.1 hypothetical protein FN976_07435 [Caenimonas sedimenti]